ncbi:uncharacterized protein LOC141849086 [Brevipalpus obovatus]|uniref:uncharacterized protein LOC141849086 n=1 Tax=Brevipalpus obovatus TaxID=246614 RepID=UPI003D9F4C80
MISRGTSMEVLPASFSSTSSKSELSADHDSISLSSDSSWQPDLSLSLSSLDSNESDLTLTSGKALEHTSPGYHTERFGSLTNTSTRKQVEKKKNPKNLTVLKSTSISSPKLELSYDDAYKSRRIEDSVRDIGVILHEKKHLLQTLKGQTYSEELEPCTSDFDKLSLKTKLEDIESQIEMCCSSLEQLLEQLHQLNRLKECEIRLKEEEFNLKRQTSQRMTYCTCACSQKKEKSKLVGRERDISAIIQATQQSQKEKRDPITWVIPIESPRSHASSARNSATLFSEKSQETSLKRAFETKCRGIYERLENRASRISARSLVRRRTAEIRQQRAIHEYSLVRQIENEDKRSRYQVQPLEPRKILSEKEMKYRSARIYSSLPEVESRKKQQQKENEARKHRMISQNFSKKLKNQALRGQVSLPIADRVKLL